VVVLGVAQDGGVPQAGAHAHAGWDDASRRRRVACLGIVDPSTCGRWMIDATPDFREQLHALHRLTLACAPAPGAHAVLDGILLTHAHIGHYTGLMFLGHESMGAKRVPVHAMPRMRAFLSSNGPWDQLVRYENIALAPLAAGQATRLNARIVVTPFQVPHRQEYSEVVGYHVQGPERAVLYVPDIDSWEELDAMGDSIETRIRTVDVAYLDATFYANGEIPGRDMTGFPHPFIVHSMQRFAALPESERAKIRFIHLNHTNPALLPKSDAGRAITAAGFRVAVEGERVDL
jgi:pyrroloquinoline quinone biosynthesis protein B